jgi:antitoxin component of MazEF toxin-antitoxin module
MQEKQTFAVFPERHGDDLLIPLPSEVVAALQIHENQRFELSVEGNRLRLTLKKPE